MRAVFNLVSFVLILVYASLTHAQAPALIALTNYQQQDVTGWLVSEKLDGVRAYWDGEKLISRQGNPFAAPDWFTEALPPFELDGELWVGRESFENTLSIVRRQEAHKDWEQIGYYIFEVPNQPGGLVSRLAVLQAYLEQQPVAHLHIIPQHPLTHLQSLDATLNALVKQGAEGLVLREPNQPYHTGRSPYALKLKPRYDAECTLTGYTEGRGKYQGQVGALICINDQQQTLRLGSGLTDAQRANPPEIGTTLTYQYSGYTQSGHPRHAVFWRVRSVQD